MKVYFIYSTQQLNIKKEAEKRIGRTYQPGMVLVNGKMRPYTEMTTDLNKINYSDYIIVASGEKSTMKYKK